jgi:ADP-ribose pyrophosphatase YjhB (NUDIX family)
LGEYAPLQKYKGIVIGIIKRLNDNEDKLVVANNINRFTKEQIQSLTEFQEQFFESKIICLDYLMQSIRVTSKAIIRKENELLVIEAGNKENEVSYLYLPGGGIEFKERSIDALHREIREELQTEIKECKFIAVIENQFKINNCELHEICFLYEVKLYEEFYKNVNFSITEDISINNSYWVNVEKIKNKSIKFYPEDAIKYL